VGEIKKTAVLSTVPIAAPLASDYVTCGLGDFFLDLFFGLSGKAGFLIYRGVFNDLLTYILLRVGIEDEPLFLLFSFPCDNIFP